MKRILVNNIVPEEQCKISGFIERLRDSKNMIFVILKDISGKIQVTIEKETNAIVADALKDVIAGSVVSFCGKAVLSQYVKMGGIEFLPNSVIIESIAQASPITKEANQDTRFNYRWLDLREDNKSLIFKVQTTMEKAMRDYLVTQNFIELHTPKISAQSTEGGAEVFKLDYFGQPAFLTQSPQLYKQMAMAAGFERVMEIGACYRAESSFTSRHATEFMGFDVEMSYIESHAEVMDLEEKMLNYMLSCVKEKHAQEIMDTFGTEVVIPTVAFPRIPFKKVIEIVKSEYGYECDEKDLDPETERLICKYAQEKLNSEFVFVTEYPSANRAFYTMRCEDDKTLSKSFDLLWKDQEITSGAQREHNADKLAAQIAEKGIDPEKMADYISFFKYGCPPHGGFGLGLGRLLAKLLNINTIKEVSYLFRSPTRLNP